MKVTLIDYTGRGTMQAASYAAAILLFTKNTRLQMSPGLFEEILAWPYEKKLEELSYMANTIPSSWEFVDYTWMIEGVTRAFTHQLVRSRTFSFAQQTMRVLNVEGWRYETGPSIKADPVLKFSYDSNMSHIAEAYDMLIRDGAAIEDARGILPTNILTNIVMKGNMRSFVELVRKRSSSRVQGEYREVLEQLKSTALAVHPWLTLFIERDFDKAASDLEAEILKLNNDLQRNKMVKLLDQMRSQS